MFVAPAENNEAVKIRAGSLSRHFLKPAAERLLSLPHKCSCKNALMFLGPSNLRQRFSSGLESDAVARTSLTAAFTGAGGDPADLRAAASCREP